MTIGSRMAITRPRNRGRADCDGAAENGIWFEQPDVLKEPQAKDLRLFQRGIDRGEFGIEGGAQPVDHGNDRKADTGRDQAVFNRGGAGLVGPKLSNNVLHSSSSSSWTSEPTRGSVARTMD